MNFKLLLGSVASLLALLLCYVCMYVGRVARGQETRRSVSREAQRMRTIDVVQEPVHESPLPTLPPNSPSALICR